MLNEFRKAYPKGSLISELLNIYQGKYVVRVLAIVDDVTLATGLAADDTLEMAEDRARLRALGAINIEPTLDRGASRPVLSTQQATELSAIASRGVPPRSPSMSTSLPSLGDRSVADFAIGESPRLPTDDSARSSSGMTSSGDDWLSSPPVHSAESNPPEQTEAISSSSWPEPATSFESIETDPVFSPSSANVATSEFPAAAPPSIPPQFESHSVSTTQELPTVAEGVPLAGNSFLDDDERKQKIAETTVEIKRLNWSTQQGRDFLEQQYNKRARSQLTNDELLDFLHYLKAQPNPS